MYRLTNEVVLGNSTFNGTNAYTYDSVGNRLARGVTGLTASITNQKFAFDKDDRLDNDTDPSTASTWFDANGNTTNYGSTFQYDVENRLISCSNASGVVTIVYNGDGQRIFKVAGGVTNLFLVDTHNPSGYAQVLEELTVGSGVTNLAAAYTYGMDLISWRRPLIATNFYAYDGNGNVRLLLNPNGAVFATYVYDAFGNLLSGGAPQNKYRYAGEQFDPNLGMYYLRSRYYHTDSGRFWTMDSFEGNQEDPLSLHKYLYAGGNPTSMTDPSGRSALLDVAFASAIGTSLESMYNNADLIVQLALQHTIIGIQNHLTAEDILYSYIDDVAIGFGIGAAIGMVADIAGDLVYGVDVEGEQIRVEANTPVVGAARNLALAESTTQDLTAAAARAAKRMEAMGLREGMPGFGTKVHVVFAEEVRALGLGSEISYKGGELAKYYGEGGSIRLDVVKGDPMHPEAVYDLKTGSARLTERRILQIRENLPKQFRNIPIVEIRIPR